MIGDRTSKIVFCISWNYGSKNFVLDKNKLRAPSGIQLKGGEHEEDS
jgi:hypothetical protein